MARTSARTTSTQAVVPINRFDDLAAAFEWFKHLLPKTAEEELEKVQAAGGLIDPVTFVDGKKSDNIAGVKIFGNIRYVSGVGPIQKAIAMLAAYVAQAAPHRTGHYRESFQWFLNGRPVDGPPNAEQVGPTGNAILANLTPYASWLEVHYPTGIMFAAFTQLKRAFGNTVAVHFGYANPDKGIGPQAWKDKAGEHPFMVPYIGIGNPGSTVKPGSSSRGTARKGAQNRRKTSDRRKGRGHRQSRGIGRGQGPKT